MARKLHIHSRSAGQNPYAHAVRALARRDPILRQVIRRVGPCTLRPVNDVLTVLVRTIISQQLATRAAQTITNRLLARLPKPLSIESLEQLDDADYRACGISEPKRCAIRDLCRHGRLGKVPLHSSPDTLTDDQWRQALLSIRGIGPWSVDMFFIFGLGRLDVFPVGDLGLRLGVQTTYGLPALPTTTELNEIGERWRPYRSVATWYMWRCRGPVPQS